MIYTWLMTRLRIVLDTNVIIGAHKTRGANYKLLERFKQGHFDLYINGHLFDEYSKKLNDLARAGKIPDISTIGPNINEISRRAIPLRVPIGIQYPTNDPDDRSLFEIAYVTPIDYIVSADKGDVLKYNGDPVLKGAVIVEAKEFLNILNTQIT